MTPKVELPKIAGLWLEISCFEELGRRMGRHKIDKAIVPRQ